MPERHERSTRSRGTGERHEVASIHPSMHPDTSAQTSRSVRMGEVFVREKMSLWEDDKLNDGGVRDVGAKAGK